MNSLYDFGKFTVEVESRTLFHDDAPIALKPKVVETLIVLIENAGNVISKDFLMEKVWGATFVEESNLSVNIYELRKAFKKFDDTENLIQTIPRRGFRFTAQVSKRELLHANGKKQLLTSESLVGENSIKNSSDDQLPEKEDSSSINFSKAKFLAKFAVGALILSCIAGLIYYRRNISVAQNFQTQTNSTNQSNAEKRPTKNLEAYQLYRRGEELWQTRSTDKMLQAIELYQRSIALDPNFVLPYVGLADTYSMLNNNPSDWKQAEDYAQKALAINPRSADALASLAFIEAMDKWQWQKAENDYKQAIELDPHCGKAHQWFATLLMIERRFDEAEIELRKAVEIEPMSPNYNSDLCEFYTYAKPYDEIKAQCLRSEEIAPLSNNNLILEQAFITESLRLNKIDKTEAEQILPPDLLKIYLKDGAHEIAESELQKTLRNPRQDSTLDDYSLSIIYAKLGDREKSLQCLERVFTAHGFLFPFVNAKREFDEMRGDSRFQDLMRRGGLNL